MAKKEKLQRKTQTEQKQSRGKGKQYFKNVRKLVRIKRYSNRHMTGKMTERQNWTGTYVPKKMTEERERI